MFFLFRLEFEGKLPPLKVHIKEAYFEG